MDQSKDMLFGEVVTFTKQQLSDWSKNKAVADEKVITAEKLKFCFGSVENIVGHGNKSTACRYQRLAVGCLIEDKKSKSKKDIILKMNHFELSPLIVRIALWKVNTYLQFQVNTFSNNRDIAKCQSFSKSKKGLNSENKNAF